MTFEYVLYCYYKLVDKFDSACEMLDSFHDILKIFGWTNENFDKALLKQVDKEWAQIHRELVLKQSCLSN